MGKHIRKKKIIDRTCYELAIERIEHAYDAFDNIVVQFSGGKDSTAVLELTLKEAEKRNRLPLKVMFFDEEAIPIQTVEYVERRRQDPRIDLEWYCVPIELRNACSKSDPTWYAWAPEDKDKWVRPLPEGAITSTPFTDGVPKEKRPGVPDLAIKIMTQKEWGGSTAQLLGIRADESLSRFWSVSHRSEYNYVINVAPGLSKVLPIYDFRTEDVWTAPALFKWDYNHAYDLMEMLGIPPSQQRCAPPFGEEPLGGLWVFAQAFPEIWDKMIERAPGVATAARYAKTELYGNVGGLSKPPGMKWSKFIYDTLAEHPESIRKNTVPSVQRMINKHYSVVDTPLLERAAHPEVGFTWREILSVAARGDTKGRREMRYMSGNFSEPGSVEHNRRQAAYEAELEMMIKNGRISEMEL
jgi:predicted phosphoadenosine phosphosulfate sulfurtransferase